MGVLTNVAEFDRFLANQVRDLKRPLVTPLVDDELAILEERFGPLAPRVAQLLSLDLDEQNIPVRELDEASYGYAIQHKSRERVLKILDALAGPSGGQQRPSTDAELLELAAAIGLIVTTTGSMRALGGQAGA